MESGKPLHPSFGAVLTWERLYDEHLLTRDLLKLSRGLEGGGQARYPTVTVGLGWEELGQVASFSSPI